MVVGLCPSLGLVIERSQVRSIPICGYCQVTTYSGQVVHTCASVTKQCNLGYNRRNKYKKWKSDKSLKFYDRLPVWTLGRAITYILNLRPLFCIKTWPKGVQLQGALSRGSLPVDPHYRLTLRSCHGPALLANPASARWHLELTMHRRLMSGFHHSVAVLPLPFRHCRYVNSVRIRPTWAP